MGEKKNPLFFPAFSCVEGRGKLEYMQYLFSYQPQTYLLL